MEITNYQEFNPREIFTAEDMSAVKSAIVACEEINYSQDLVKLVNHLYDLYEGLLSDEVEELAYVYLDNWTYINLRKALTKINNQ